MIPALPFIESRGVSLSVHQAHASAAGCDQQDVRVVGTRVQSAPDDVVVNEITDWVGVRGDPIALQSHQVYECSFVLSIDHRPCSLSDVLAIPKLQVLVRRALDGRIVFSSRNLIRDGEQRARVSVPFVLQDEKGPYSVEIGFYPAHRNMSAREFFLTSSRWEFTVGRVDALVMPAPYSLCSTSNSEFHPAFDHDPRSMLITVVMLSPEDASLRGLIKEWAGKFEGQGIEVCAVASREELHTKPTYARPSYTWLVECKDRSDVVDVCKVDLNSLRQNKGTVLEWEGFPHTTPVHEWSEARRKT